MLWSPTPINFLHQFIISFYISAAMHTGSLKGRSLNCWFLQLQRQSRPHCQLAPIPRLGARGEHHNERVSERPQRSAQRMARVQPEDVALSQGLLACRNFHPFYGVGLRVVLCIHFFIGVLGGVSSVCGLGDAAVLLGTRRSCFH